MEDKNLIIDAPKINTGLLRTAELKVTEKRELSKKDLKYMRDKDRELVTGVFRFFECPNMPMRFVFRKYKEDPVETYEMYDGEVYTIPLSVAKHLNQNGWYPINEYILNKAEQPNKDVRAPKGNYRMARKVRRFGFQSMDFMDAVEYDSAEKKIIPVTNI